MSEEKDVKTLIAEAVKEATEGLANKNKELLAELKEARKGQEIKPEVVEKLQAQIDALEKDLSEAQKSNKEKDKVIEKVNAQLQSESGFTTKLLLDNGLTDALVKAGVAAPMLPAVKAMLSQQAKVVAEGETRKAVIGDKDLQAFISEWAGSDEGKHFIQAPSNNGGGALGNNANTGKQTVKRESFDAMSQAERASFVKSGGTVTD